MKQNNEKLNKAMHKFVGVFDKYENNKHNSQTKYRVSWVTILKSN